MSQQRTLRHMRLAMLLLWIAVSVAAVADAAGRPTPAVEWVTLEDPLEQAFTVEVPPGWVARAGMFRFGLTDVRPLVDLTSPDGRINVRLGDVAVPHYALPRTAHPRDGELDDLGAQEQRVVAHYRGGPEFVVLYARARFSGSCRDAVTDTQDMDFMVPEYMHLETPTRATSTGQIAYHCNSDRGVSVSFAFARTYVSSCCWRVPTLASFLAPAGQAGLARAVLLHTLRSFRLGDAWIQRQRALEADAVQYQQWRRSGAPIDLSRLQAMEGRIAAWRREAQRYCSQFADLSIVDPLTVGDHGWRDGSLEVYWTNGLGNVISAPAAPSTAWRPLSVHRSSRG